MLRLPKAYLIINGETSLTCSCDLPGSPSIEIGLESLARALSSSPIWQRLDRAVMVVRSEPVPMLGVIGYFNEAEASSVEGIGWQLRHWSRHTLYLDYRKVEEDCRRLAELLKNRVDEKVLREGHFAGIPRGGLIVLGILSYFLGLRPEQLDPTHESRWLIVVDDCAISGARFQEFLAGSSAEALIFVHLYSHPELRDSICRTEARVKECFAVGDLTDHAAEFFGDGYGDWQRRWAGRGAAYWNGLPERLCFPWTETDVAVWNPVSQSVEPGWRLIPSEWCFKNIADVSRIQFQKSGEDSVRVTSGVLYAELEDDVLVADMSRSRMFVLNDLSGAAWKRLLDGPNSFEKTIESGNSRNERGIDSDLLVHLDQFLSAGLLELQNGS